MSKKKDCAFQFAITHGEIRTPHIYIGGKVEVVEDTPLVTLEEAKQLWNKYLPKFKEAMRNEESAEMCIWSDMKEIGDYHTALYDLDTRDNIKLEDDTIYLIKEETVGEL